MQDEIAAIVGTVAGGASVFARNLTTGAELSLDADRTIPTGSAAKTFVLLAYAQLVSDGALDPAARVSLPPAEQHGIGGSGVLRYLAGGLQPTLDDLAWLMMIVSDNVATDFLLDAMGGREPVNAVMDAVGHRPSPAPERLRPPSAVERLCRRLRHDPEGAPLEQGRQLPGRAV